MQRALMIPEAQRAASAQRWNGVPAYHITPLLHCMRLRLKAIESWPHQDPP